MGLISVKYHAGGIDGLCVIKPAVHGDCRGYFMETYNQKDLADAGLSYDFVQDNQSMSKKGVLRGMHFQIAHPQAKLIRVVRGSIYDVAVDLRSGSPTYGNWHGELLTEENKKQLLVPHGFAHGYLVLSDSALVCYKCDDFYRPDDEGGFAWNDPDIAIRWPEVVGTYRGDASADGYQLRDGTPLILSDKDQARPLLKDLSFE